MSAVSFENGNYNCSNIAEQECFAIAGQTTVRNDDDTVLVSFAGNNASKWILIAGNLGNVGYKTNGGDDGLSMKMEASELIDLSAEPSVPMPDLRAKPSYEYNRLDYDAICFIDSSGNKRFYYRRSVNEPLIYLVSGVGTVHTAAMSINHIQGQPTRHAYDRYVYVDLKSIEQTMHTTIERESSGGIYELYEDYRFNANTYQQIRNVQYTLPDLSGIDLTRPFMAMGRVDVAENQITFEETTPDHYVATSGSRRTITGVGTVFLGGDFYTTFSDSNGTIVQETANFTWNQYIPDDIYKITAQGTCSFNYLKLRGGANLQPMVLSLDGGEMGLIGKLS